MFEYQNFNSFKSAMGKEIVERSHLYRDLIARYMLSSKKTQHRTHFYGNRNYGIRYST